MNRQRSLVLWLGWLGCWSLGWGALANGQEQDRSPPAEAGEYRMLCDGRDLSEWDGDPRLWSVVDGAIRGETTAERAAEGNTFLIWQAGQLKDFELRLSFRCNAANNSGIQYRSQRREEAAGKNRWIVAGYQHEIRNELDLPNVAGFIYDERGDRGRLCLVGEQAVWTADGKKQVLGALLTADEFRQIFRLNDWNDVVIIAEGNRLRHYLNGRLVVDFRDEDPQRARREGVLALQLHAGAPMWVEFKNLRLKELAAADKSSR